jgi:hypothetical protein
MARLPPIRMMVTIVATPAINPRAVAISITDSSAARAPSRDRRLRHD